MLQIIESSNFGRGHVTATWEIGQVLPYNMSTLSVVEVIADGEELDHVLYHVKNLPQVRLKPPVQNWFGDHARFIVAMLIHQGRNK